MAKETITKLIDDLDGGQAAETVRFALDDRVYEIDLSTKNATKLRNALAPFIDGGQRIAGRPTTAGRNGTRNGRHHTTTPDPEQNRAIREWAEAKGYEVAPRGRIRADIIELYHSNAGR